MRDRYQPHLIFGLFFLMPMLLYALYTQHAWEDWYITYRASKNPAIGNGLVFQSGERLHTFTSPLGTLIPALINKLRPDWLVLRDYEIGLISSQSNVLTRQYSVAKVFDVSKQIDSLQHSVMGQPYLSRDSRFTVFQHTAQPTATASVPDH